MTEENDWRLTNQEKYLKRVTLVWKKYTAYREDWDHDHCEFCLAKFMDKDDPEAIREGYSTEDNYRWICQQCYEDFKDIFQWKIK